MGEIRFILEIRISSLNGLAEKITKNLKKIKFKISPKICIKSPFLIKKSAKKSQCLFAAPQLAGKCRHTDSHLLNAAAAAGPPFPAAALCAVPIKAISGRVCVDIQQRRRHIRPPLTLCLTISASRAAFLPRRHSLERARSSGQCGPAPSTGWLWLLWPKRKLFASWPNGGGGSGWRQCWPPLTNESQQQWPAKLDVGPSQSRLPSLQAGPLHPCFIPLYPCPIAASRDSRDSGIWHARVCPAGCQLPSLSVLGPQYTRGPRQSPPNIPPHPRALKPWPHPRGPMLRRLCLLPHIRPRREAIPARAME